MRSTSSRSCRRVIPFWYLCLKKIGFWFINMFLFIPNLTFLVRFAGISGEFGRALVRILARRSRAKIPMARANEPDMPPKRTKKVRLGIKRNILINQNPIFFKQWYQNGITRLQDLLDVDRTFLSLQKFQQKLGLDVPFTTYHGLINSIPASWRQKIKFTKLISPT